MRPLVSPRARVVAVICYLGLPLPYGALGTGRWDGLVAYAAIPFIAVRLARAAGIAPYAAEPGPHWRSRPAGQVAILGVVIALVVELRAGGGPARPGHGAGLGGRLRPGRGARVRAGGSSWSRCEALVVALVLAAPWVVGTALAGKGSVAIFGLPISGTTAPNWGEVIRFAIGPAARSPIVWLLVAGALLPLVIGRGTRLRWAARLWVTACASWGLALAATRGDLGSFAPSESVVLAPAALAVAACVGLGISAFENDLTGREFGWRQVVSVGSLAFVGARPPAGGRRARAAGVGTSPTQGVEQPLAFLGHPSTAGVARVLWLGDPRALPAGGWSVQPGLAFALTPEDLPDSAQVFTPAGPGPAALVARRGPAGDLRRDGAPGPAARPRRRALRRRGQRRGAVHGGHGPASVSAPPPRVWSATCSSRTTSRPCPACSASTCSRTARRCR